MHRSPSHRIIAATAVCVIGTSACSTVHRLVGDDTSAHTDVCAVVAPAGLPPRELARAVDAVVQQAGDERGSLTVFVATNASASSFATVAFDDEAHGGSFRSSAANDEHRTRDVDRWTAAAREQIDAQLTAAALGDGIDLVGGVAQCARQLGDRENAAIAVIASGVHRTVDLDVGREPARADELRAAVVGAVGHELRLDLYGVGRVDPTATDGPVARDVIGPVTDAWTNACHDLGDRCRFHGAGPTTKEA